MSHNVLVVDDEPKLCDLLSSALSQNDIQVFTAGNGLQALAILEQEDIDLVISDWRMPGMDGPQLLAEVKLRYPQLPVIVMTAYSTVKNAVQSMRNGAYDYIAKPFDIDELDITVSKALQFRDILRDNARLRAELDEHQHIDSLIGDSPSFRRVLQAIDSVRESSATILLTGESGTGKEMVARAIHKHGSRADKPFVAVNCAAIPEGLLESEMFGHRKGAFTGAVAVADRVGRFMQADKGTLFLDEVGDMPLALQAKILRALQERVIEPVGDPRERKVDVRVIAATNKNLLQAVADKEFREDLYYRLNVFPIPLPALRERVEDIASLARHFAHNLGATAGKRITGFSPSALQAMAQYSWPGNIRELQNCVERATIVANSSTIQDSDLPPYLFSAQPGQSSALLAPGPSVPPDLEAALAEVEKAYILSALQQANGVQAAAAQLIGISERSFWYRLKKLDIHVDKIVR